MSLKNTYTAALIFFAFIVCGQTRLDTLRKKLISTDINEKVVSCAELAWELRNVNWDSAFVYAFKAEKWLTREVTEINRAYVYHYLGSLYSKKSEYAESIPWLLKAYAIRKKEKDELQLISTCSNLAFSYQGTGDLRKTLSFVLEAEQLCDKITNRAPHLYIITINQLADVYYSLKRYEKSEELYKKAIVLAEKRQDDSDLSMIYQNYGAFLLGVERFNEALPFLEKGIKHEEKLNDPEDLLTAKVNLAIVYAESGKNERALEIFREVYEYYKRSGSDYDKSTSSNNLGFFYFMNENNKQAIELFKESLAHAEKAKAAKLVMQRYEIMSECYEAMSDLTNALKYRKLFMAMKDSLLNQETVKQLNDLTEKYDTERKERRILELQKNNAEIKMKEEEARQKSVRNTMILVGLIVFVLVVAGFIYYSLLQKKKANSELTVKNREIARQHLLLEEKQKEIIDSIQYAKRIQSSLMAHDKYIDQNLDRLKKDNKLYH